MTTNFESNQSLGRILERIQIHLGEAKKLVEGASPGSIPSNLVQKSRTLSTNMEIISERMKSKERSE